MVGNFCNRTACRIRNRRPRHDNNMTLRKKENPKSLPTLHGLESRAKIFAPSSRRGVFSLDSPLYRTRLPEKWNPSQDQLGRCPVSRAYRTAIDRMKERLAASNWQTVP